ncbi:MAG: hypothetical protein Q8R07_01665 [Candidatus Uhrbacteria bacterium]|nr:hypothetical protein [Candidatus Uhrbacteria bacterium]
MKAWTLLCLFFVTAPIAEARRRPEPLLIRMLNPCALSHGYWSSSSKNPMSAFWVSVLKGIPAVIGDRDARGNTLIKFNRWSDGVEACRRFYLGSHYADLPITDAIRRWDGGATWQKYAAYVSKRTGLRMETKIRLLTVKDHRKLIEAQAEWEAGRVKRGRMRNAEL